MRSEDAGRGTREWDGPPFGERRERDDVDDQRAGWLGDHWRGPYAGRGPKGYQRPDERVREDVCDLLCAHAGVDASDVEVHVAACEVTLTGTIATRAQKRLAEDLASTVGGVKDVHNQLRVIQPEPWPGSTDWQTRAA